MKILVVSKVSWRDESNGGNVLTNVFKGFDAEFAMITCSGVEPSNNICKRYYQLSDKMMVSNIIHRTKVGKVLEYKDFPRTKYQEESYSKSKKIVPGNFLRLIRELIWKTAKWDKKGIASFVSDFQPDIIYAPCQALYHMIRLVKYVAEVAKVPVVSYISDDHYTNNQYSFSPLFWINHFFMRKRIREVFSLYSLCYTMTDEQKERYRLRLCEADMKLDVVLPQQSNSYISNH